MPRPIFRLAAAAAGLLLGAVLLQPGLAASAAAATTTAVETGPVFNDPNGTVEQQKVIRTRILELIHGAAPGSDIKATVYHFWDIEVARALVAAHTERQVDVQVMLDQSSADLASSTTYQTLLDALGGDRTQPSFAGLCPEHPDDATGATSKSCLGDPADGASISHNKFWLFSDTGGSQNVVVQTSSNLSSASWNKLHNDAFVLTDASVHASYAAYFTEMAAMDWQSWQYTTQPTSGPYKPYFFPRTSAGDTVVSILNNIDSCTYTGADGQDRPTRVQVGMFKITRQAVADKLADLAVQGCDVRVVYAESDAGTWDALHAPDGSLAVRCHNFDDDGDPATSREYIHSKFLLIEGAYYGKVDKIAWTGSHNYTGPALTENDEALLKVNDDTVHDVYAGQLTKLFQAANPGEADAVSQCRGVISTREA